MARNKCFCDQCQKLIYKDSGGRKKPIVIKYWSATMGDLENNRKIPNEFYDLCSIECCEKFLVENERKLTNPFAERYIEYVPVKVLGELE